MAPSKPDRAATPTSEQSLLARDVRSLMDEQIRTTANLGNLADSVKILIEKFDGVTVQLARQQTLIEVMQANIKSYTDSQNEHNRKTESELKRLAEENAEQDRVLVLWRGAFGVLIFAAPFGITMLLKLLGLI